MPPPGSPGSPTNANPGGWLFNSDAQNDGQMTVKRS
jgi:hypothetical protein